MRWMLARIMALNLLSLYALIYAMVNKTNDMSRQLNSFQMMNDSSLGEFLLAGSESTVEITLSFCLPVCLSVRIIFVFSHGYFLNL